MANDREILEAIYLLGQAEGIFTEPAGGTTLASAIKLIQSDVIAKDESIVICVTGNGYKTAEIMAATVPKPITLGRTLNEFEAFIAGRQPN